MGAALSGRSGVSPGPTTGGSRGPKRRWTTTPDMSEQGIAGMSEAERQRELQAVREQRAKLQLRFLDMQEQILL